MSRKLLAAGAIVLLMVLAAAPPLASAHQTIQIGDYAVEYGWLNEPVIVGQSNAIVVNISQPAAAGASMDMGSISLAAPADGAAVAGDQVEVTVAFAGLDDPSMSAGEHWRLDVDGQTLSMIPLHQTTVAVSGLSNGEHAIGATLVNASHAAIGQPATAKVTLSGAADTGTPSVSGVEPLDMTGAPTEAMADVDVSKLKIEVVYGGESKTLALQPLGEDTPGQFIAPLTPTRAGRFTIRLSGQIEQTDVGGVEVQPEEVQTADIVEFPKAAAAESADSAGLGLTGWLAVAGVVLGLAGVVMGGLALARRKQPADRA